MAETTKAATCARCKQLADQFFPIDTGMRVALKEAGIAENLPEQVCPTCYESLTSHVSQGLKLRMERDAREKNKMVMWKNRVHLIKNARSLMNQKAYSEAAVQYEKYLRVLEMVYNLKKGELSPAVFNNSSRSKELTVIASVYWDLVRIYDSNPRYGDRMQISATKLSQFLPFSPIYPDIIKKAEQFGRTCKNPNVLRVFLKNTKSKRGPCFVADAAFGGDPGASEPHIFRKFRDQRLRPYYLGRQVVWLYYRTSPPVAAWIAGSQLKTRAARWFLTKIATGLKKSLKTG
jgi:hypothetical protein